MNSLRHRFVRQLKTRPRLIIAAATAILVGLILPAKFEAHVVTRLLIAWNTGVVLYTGLAISMMTRSSRESMRQRAQQQDEGQFVILILVVLSSMASLAAIGGELAVVKDMHGTAKAAHVALASFTVLSSWTFTQIMFAQHYAHDYYAAESNVRKPGLSFPEDDDPDYGDFFYFSAVIGTSGQTADVSFVSKTMRRVGSVHCILAYLFNTTVLALLINIGASLF